MFRQITAIIRESRNALEATQARSVLWMCMDYDSFSVVSCREMQPSVYKLRRGKAFLTFHFLYKNYDRPD
jgi:hypothetical protein